MVLGPLMPGQEVEPCIPLDKVAFNWNGLQCGHGTDRFGRRQNLWTPKIEEAREPLMIARAKDPR